MYGENRTSSAAPAWTRPALMRAKSRSACAAVVFAVDRQAKEDGVGHEALLIRRQRDAAPSSRSLAGGWRISIPASLPGARWRKPSGTPCAGGLHSPAFSRTGACKSAMFGPPSR